MKSTSKKTRQFVLSLSAIACALALGILLIQSADAIEKKYALKQDLSFNRVTSYGSVTGEVLSSLKTPVHIYALFTPGQEDQQLLGLLERYQAASRQLTYSRENLAQNPTLVHSISNSIDDSAVTTDCLIVHCAAKDRTRILTAEDYVTQSFDAESGGFVLSGANYENSLTEAIAYVTSDTLPALYFLQGHGELSDQETQPLQEYLSAQGYELKAVDLSRGDALPDRGLLFILSPRKDFSEAELAQLTAYAENGGSFFITSDYNDPSDLTNFNTLLRAYHVSLLEGVVMAEESDAGSYYDSPLYLMPYMQHSEITTPLISLQQDRLMLAGARALSLGEDTSGKVVIASLLKSGKATLRAFDGKTIADKTPETPVAAYDLAAYANRAGESGNRSSLFIIGNSSVFTVEWLFSNTYSTEFLTSIVQTVYPEHPTDLAIPPKAAFRPSLGFGSMLLPTALIAVVPLLILISAWAVLSKRQKL